MNIAIIGYGKMGQGIASLMPKDWTLKLKCDIDNPLERLKKEELSGIDLFFEFTEPGVSKNNIKLICEAKKEAKIVSGTTGWDVIEAKEAIMRSGSMLLHSANFSLGINTINSILGNLAASLNKGNGFSISMKEYHHKNKKDSPSGTAKLLAATIEAKEEKCPITSVREGEYPGIHIVQFKSEFETIEVKHEVSSRQVFCAGAVLSAKWLAGQKRPGIYSFSDVIRASNPSRQVC